MALVNGGHSAAMSERATWQACSHKLLGVGLNGHGGRSREAAAGTDGLGEEEVYRGHAKTTPSHPDLTGRRGRRGGEGEQARNNDKLVAVLWLTFLM
jgi:hypothetical protein